MARPRSIPEEDVLESALLQFWEQGYDRTSIADLAAAIGLGPSSLYNSFGSKKELYRRALEHYVRTRTAFVGETSARAPEVGLEATLRELLREAVRLYTAPENPAGCAMLQSGGPGSPEEADGACIAHGFQRELSAALRTMFRRVARTEELPASPETLARFLVGSMRGLAHLATGGATRAELDRVAELAVRACVLPR